MDEYVRSDTCLMDFLCRALESPLFGGACNRCARCRPDLALPATVDGALIQEAADLLRKSYLPIIPRMKWADAGSAAAAFGIAAKQGIPAELMMNGGMALSQYGAGEWGRLVRDGKYLRKPAWFDDRLVEACAEMFATWKPDLWPQWVVPVPSLRSPALVGDFAERLARRLGLPCCRCLRKIADRPPQKEMENSVFQQNNALGAFGLADGIPAGGCLLVDDMVDSRWTLTVAAALLRKSGVPFVIPLALADSSVDGD